MIQSLNNASPPTILVVDDIDANLVMLERMLKMNSYKVIKAKNGAQAIEVFSEKRPDLILMDINMPKVNGHEATKHIRTITDTHHIPIIFVTAMSEEASLTQSLAAGGDDFICKPVSYDVLHSKISAHLRIKELNEELNIKNQELAKHNARLLYEHTLIDRFFENALAQSDLDEKLIKYHISSKSAFNGDVLLAKYDPNGVFYLLLGDFTGHGLTAAMGTLPVAQIFFKMVQQAAPLHELARELNHQLKTFLPVELFFAANLLQLDSKTGQLKIWSGAMPPALWTNKAGKAKGSFVSNHMPLGVLRDSEFNDEVKHFKVANGDRIYLYTDGITEMRNPDGEMFGSDQIQKVLLSSGENGFTHTLDTLNAFRGDHNPEDDSTFLQLTCRLP